MLSLNIVFDLLSGYDKHFELKLILKKSIDKSLLRDIQKFIHNNIPFTYLVEIELIENIENEFSFDKLINDNQDAFKRWMQKMQDNRNLGKPNECK